jgi:hypothetical protein
VIERAVKAVPGPPPDPTRMAATLPRVLGVIADAAPAVVLTTSMIAVRIDPLAAP